ncbi:nuclear transport factor 2 family protein [Sphingomonas solaris]|nr:nuclear transport factor 2 family protein [Sphingomonas solaris]
MNTPAFTAETSERGYRFLAAEVRRPQQFPREEVEAALARYFALAGEAAETGDWNAWADLFTEDAVYIEHAFGILRGREGIRAWVTAVTGAKPTDLRMTDEWHVIDNDLCIVYASNWRADPAGGDPYQFNAVAMLCYAGNGQWCYEEDVYNALEAQQVMQAHAAAKSAAG